MKLFNKKIILSTMVIAHHNYGMHEEYEDTLNTVNDIIINQKNYGFFTTIYNNLFKLLPGIIDLENQLTTLKTGGLGDLERLMGFSQNMYLEELLELHLSHGYYIMIWEDIKVQLGTVFMKNILERVGGMININIKRGDIFKKIYKKNYKIQNLIISKEVEEILDKVIFVLNMESRQKLVYIVGEPGTGKTTVMINELVKLGYVIYYINGNSVLLSEHGEHTIIGILDNLKRDILLLPLQERNKTLIIFDECEVALKDVGQLNKLIASLKNDEDITARISENQWEKEKALTSFMMYMLSLDGLPVICISNSVDISPYMERRITYLVNFSMDTMENYITMWKELLYQYNVEFEEGNIDDLIYTIGLFSLENKISIRTIKQFTLLFAHSRVSINSLFQYCAPLKL